MGCYSALANVPAIFADNRSFINAYNASFQNYMYAIVASGTGTTCSINKCDVRMMARTPFHCIDDASFDVSNTIYDQECIIAISNHRNANINMRNNKMVGGVRSSQEDQTKIQLPQGVSFYM